MEKVAIGTNDLGMHIVIRPISKALLSKDETVGMETGKINSLLTARRPITLVGAISALPPLLPSSADPLTLPVVETRGFSVLRGLPSGTDMVL